MPTLRSVVRARVSSLKSVEASAPALPKISQALGSLADSLPEVEVPSLPSLTGGAAFPQMPQMPQVGKQFVKSLEGIIPQLPIPQAPAGVSREAPREISKLVFE